MSSSEPAVYKASATAPVNIAVVKYWGKRDVKLNLPTNSSASVTLSQLNMRAHTTATCVPTSDTDSDTAGAVDPIPDTLILNNETETITPRTQACLSELRALRAELEAEDPSLPKLSSLPLRIVSHNNFPTAAGLASSAAGFAALVKAVAELYQLPMSGADLSGIARQGSGSACRSMLGGYVAWQMGTSESGKDSVAVQIAPASHWPEMRALILVANAAKKDVGSTVGMQRTVATSQLFKHRVSSVVPEHMDLITEAIMNRDFATFADVTMRDSNSFHAVCLDSVPPIFYMTDASRAVVAAVTALNELMGEPIAAYTFDAGPNAVIYFLHKNRKLVLQFLRDGLEGTEEWKRVVAAAEGDVGGLVDGEPGNPPSGGDGAEGEVEAATASAAEALVGALEQPVRNMLHSGIRSVIYTAVGEGARRVEEHLA